MNVIDYIVSILNQHHFYDFFIVGSFFLIGIGILFFIGIQTKGKDLLIDALFKHKQFNRFVLKTRYKVQAPYTFVLGIGLLIVLLTVQDDGVMVFL